MGGEARGLHIDLLGPVRSQRDGEPLELGPVRRQALLAALVLRAGTVVSHEQLLGDVWGYRYTGGTRTVDVHVRRLREKLPPLVTSLVTVKQFGYKLVDTEET